MMQVRKTQRGTFQQLSAFWVFKICEICLCYHLTPRSCGPHIGTSLIVALLMCPGFLPLFAMFVSHNLLQAHVNTFHSSSLSSFATLLSALKEQELHSFYNCQLFLDPNWKWLKCHGLPWSIFPPSKYICEFFVCISYREI